jgi:hypothetical protein
MMKRARTLRSLPVAAERTQELLAKLDEAAREARLLKARIEGAQSVELAPTLRPDSAKPRARGRK